MENPLMKTSCHFAAAVFCMMVFFSCSSSQPDYYLPGPDRVDGPAGLASTVPVIFGTEIGPGPDTPRIRIEPTKRGVPSQRIAHVRLHIKGIPESREGESFTIIGGGTDGRGLHGPESTGFKDDDKGYHFAQSEMGEAENVRRSNAYKQDYTSTVKDGSLSFDIYYEPSDIHQWGERYFPGTEVALTMMKAGTEERVLHAANNAFNWAIAGVRAGRSVDIFIELE